MLQRIEHMPAAFFSTVMGLSGLTIALQKAGQHVHSLALVADVLAPLTAAVFVVLLLLYGIKVVKFFAAVQQEFRHPIKMSFTATLSISLILLSVIFLHGYEQLSFYLWCGGSLLHLLLTLYVLSTWIHHSHFDIVHINPAWFIPVVGNILVPIAGVEHANPEISWFFFAIGLVFWLVLFTIIIYRVIFHPPMAERLWPTLFILIAPPAVGFVAYMRLTGELDSFARILYYIALFITLLLLVQAKRFIKLPFFLSWWAYSFPLAAMSIASFALGDQLGFGLALAIGYVLLALLGVVILVLVIRTVKAIMRNEICVEE
jgi:tellurite resistance protein